MRLPNFLIIGAPRCGTTTLYHAAREHPDIYMSPVKEPLFFGLEGERQPYRGPQDAQGIRDLDTYLALFADAETEPVVGEASTHYLALEGVPEAIHARLPSVKLLAILRNPVERALSHWALHVWEGREPLGFKQALEAETDRAQAGWSPAWCYRGLGLYGAQLERYLRLFPPAQLLVVLNDDLERDFPRQLREVWRSLEVATDFQPSLSTRWNAGGLPRNRMLHRVLLCEQHPLRRALRPWLAPSFRKRTGGTRLSRACSGAR